MTYYVKMTDSRVYPVRVMYKRYKCAYGWCPIKDCCWQFSREGAKKIVKRLNEGASKGVTYEMEKVE